MRRGAPGGSRQGPRRARPASPGHTPTRLVLAVPPVRCMKQAARSRDGCDGDSGALLVSMLCLELGQYLSLDVTTLAIVHGSAPAISRDLRTVLLAGVTASLYCMLCGAGTYQTGSGLDALIWSLEASVLCSTHIVVFWRP